MRVGVLALQGDVIEHLGALERLGADAFAVRTREQLDACDALVMPGGESTAIAHLARTSGLDVDLKERLDGGLVTFGTCAGLVLLATDVLDGREDQLHFDRLDVTVRRNGYGRQVASFEAPVELRDGTSVPGVFIRAPRIVEVHDGVEVLAHVEGPEGRDPVAVRSGNVIACCFHPELTDSLEFHRQFLELAGH